jgi:hypothetical protein
MLICGLAIYLGEREDEQKGVDQTTDVVLVVPKEPLNYPLNGYFLHDGWFFSCDKSRQFGETRTRGRTHDLAGPRPLLCV